MATGAEQKRFNDAAYSFLKEKLLNGAFGSGERISTDAIVAQIGTSKQPVMVALKRLASEGFLEIIPQVGCRVIAVEHADIVDYLRLFASMEGTFAEMAAQRSTPQEIAELRAIIDSFSQNLKSDPPSSEVVRLYRHHNREFHAKIHMMAHSSMVHQLATEFWDRTDFYLTTASGKGPFYERFDRAVAEHQRIAEAISWGDAAVTRKLMEEHVKAFGDEDEALE